MRRGCLRASSGERGGIRVFPSEKNLPSVRIPPMMRLRPRTVVAGPMRLAGFPLALSPSGRGKGEGDCLSSKRRPVNGTGVAALHRPFRSNRRQETEAGLLQDWPEPHSRVAKSAVSADCTRQVIATFHDHAKRASDDAGDCDRQGWSPSFHNWRALNKACRFRFGRIQRPRPAFLNLHFFSSSPCYREDPISLAPWRRSS